MRQFSTGIVGFLLATSLSAATETDYSAVEARMRTLAPTADLIAVSETPIEGILEVQINGDVIYTSADGKYLFQGRVIDLDTREDLTETSRESIRKALMGRIDPDKQISFSPPEPVYELTVFTDIDCGYCRKLHGEVEAYNEQGIAIHYMAFPRAGVGSHSYEKAVSVWCADNQQEALTQAKLGAEPDPQQCENPISEQFQLGIEMGINSTPALLTSSGQLIAGYVPPEQLRARLDQMAAAAASTE